MSLTQPPFKMKQKKPKTNDQATQWLWELAIIMGCEPYKLRFALGFMQKTPHTSNCDCFAQVIFFPEALWMIYDVLTPHPTRLHKEERKTRDWAKLKKQNKKKIFLSRFHLGFSQITFFTHWKCLLIPKCILFMQGSPHWFPLTVTSTLPSTLCLVPSTVLKCLLAPIPPFLPQRELGRWTV